MKTAISKQASIHSGISHRDLDATQVRTVLVPTDFSAPAAKALDYACALAKKFHATVHLLHVNDVRAEQPALAQLSALDTEIGQKLRRRLENTGAECEAEIVSTQCHLRDGKAFDEICRSARLIHADLIVIATHGYTGMQHRLIGSTAERVVRRAACPVLVVRHEHRQFAHTGDRHMIEVKKILVPVDFSDHSARALRFAVSWAKHFGAKLTLLHSVYPHYYATNEEYRLYDWPRLLESLRGAAETEMREFVRRSSFSGVSFETHVVVGFAATEIKDFASSNNCDLIVTATHGRTGFKHVLIGSVAESIVRNSPCPVLVIPTRKARS